MTGARRHNAPDHGSANKTPTRDSQGRWVRRTVVAEKSATQDFVFDDRVIEEMPPPEPEAPPLILNNEEDTPASALEVAAVSRPAAGAAPEEDFDFDTVPPEPAPEAATTSPRRPLSRPFRLLVGALLLAVAILVFRRVSSYDAGPAEVIAPPPPPTIVAPVVVPPAPKQSERRPTTRDSAAGPRERDPGPAAVVAPIVVPPAPEPAAPKPAVSVPLPLPSLPDRPLVVEEGEDADPAGAADSRETLDEEGWFDLAEEYLQLGDENRAEALYRRILNEGAQPGRAALALGDLFARRGDFDRAKEFYRTSTQLFQNRTRAAGRP